MDQKSPPPFAVSLCVAATTTTTTTGKGFWKHQLSFYLAINDHSLEIMKEFGSTVLLSLLAEFDFFRSTINAVALLAVFIVRVQSLAR